MIYLQSILFFFLITSLHKELPNKAKALEKNEVTFRNAANRYFLQPKTSFKYSKATAPRNEVIGNITDDEIQELTEQLYEKEQNSALKFIQVNLQSKTRSTDRGDEASEPLLVVDEKALRFPSISKMRTLFDNYEMDTLTNEVVTPRELQEQNNFLSFIMLSNIMRHTMNFLQRKGLVGSDTQTQLDFMKNLWFTQYSRGKGKVGSSGFEHVFLNEVKNGTIIGLHNWIYFYEEEKAGRLNYKGYIKKLDIENKLKVLKIRFSHHELEKPVNTIFIGSSPEFELALYTLCFKVRPDLSCPISLGGTKFKITTFSWRYRGKYLIGSAFPEI